MQSIHEMISTVGVDLLPEGCVCVARRLCQCSSAIEQIPEGTKIEGRAG